MYNLERLSTLGTRDTGRRQTTIMYNLERLSTLGTRDTGRRQTIQIKPKTNKTQHGPNTRS